MKERETKSFKQKSNVLVFYILINLKRNNNSTCVSCAFWKSFLTHIKKEAKGQKTLIEFRNICELNQKMFELKI